MQIPFWTVLCTLYTVCFEYFRMNAYHLVYNLDYLCFEFVRSVYITWFFLLLLALPVIERAPLSLSLSTIHFICSHETNIWTMICGCCTNSNNICRCDRCAHVDTISQLKCLYHSRIMNFGLMAIIGIGKLKLAAFNFDSGRF